MSKSLTIRVQSSEGTKRVDVDPKDNYAKLYKKVADAYGLQSTDVFVLYKEKNKQMQLPSSTSKSIQSTLSHGDMIYAVFTQPDLFSTTVGDEKSVSFKSETPSGSMNGHTTTSSPRVGSFGTANGRPYATSRASDAKEEEVDVQLEKVDGRVPRQRDPQLCHHNVNGKCIHCIPIEPYDEEYLKTRNPPVKYLSFHAYLRKLQSSSPGDRATFASLENINCSIKERCATGHAPWPKGICTKCQPNPLTLNRQNYRHVDNIMFENGALMNRFLNYWRQSGHQRIGFLYGRYEAYDQIPLGIKAVVSAIYEPPQETSRDSVKLTQPDPHEALVEDLARKLGMKRIGWIFTDLIPDETKKAPVVHHRGTVESFFLSAQECITAGHLQNKNPNVCKFSPDGYFGSKFVTVVVTGDATGNIHFEGYQVTNQGTALVKSKILLPTYDAPELGYIKETSSEQYVPDVFYREKDSYNNEIVKVARPLPLVYLIVDIPVGFPAEGSPIRSLFNDTCQALKTPFPVENRMQVGELQDMNALSTYLRQFRPSGAAGVVTSPASRVQANDILGDLHLLLYLAANDIISFSMNQLDPLLDALRSSDTSGVETWMESGDWQTIIQVMQTQSPSSPGGTSRPGAMDLEDQRGLAAQWSCGTCTFLNSGSSQTCEMCGSNKGS